MNRSILRKEVLPFVLMFGSLIVATAITDALLHAYGLYWIGRYLGIPGTILILLSFFYSMRKRKLIHSGSPRTLLQLHEVLTWVGALMILVNEQARCFLSRCRQSGGPVTDCGGVA